MIKHRLKSYLYRFLEKTGRHPKKMKELKNKYQGQTCFIVSTGPSLTLDDLNKINGYKSFSMNSIVNSFDKTKWRPNFYVISDTKPFNSLKKTINPSDFDAVFFPNLKPFKNVLKADNLYYFKQGIHNIDKANMLKDYKTYLHISDNVYKYFADGPSVVFNIIQLAIYLGFKTIYLLGQDCSVSKAFSHSDIAPANYKSTIPDDTNDWLIQTFQNYYFDVKKYNVTIINCTRGGNLEVFPRKALEDIV